MTHVPIGFDPTAASLKTRAARNDQELQEAARQLEGVFVGILFEEMAKTVDKENSLFGQAAGADMYDSWFRTEIAKQFTESGGTGLGDAIARSLGATVAARVEPPRTVAQSLGPQLPVAGPVTSRFGTRTHPVTGARHEHHGVDIAVPIGTPIEAPFAGRVKRIGHEGPMGHHVVVEHPNGYETVYAHASEVLVRPGQSVASGEVLAKSGSSGRSTGPHLHFSLLRDGKPIDPMRWLGTRSPVSGR